MNRVTADAASLRTSLSEGLRQGLFGFNALLKIMVPVYILIAVLNEIKVVGYLAGICGPFMKYFGLPGEAALAVITGWSVNLYGAIAVIAGLALTTRQVTILAIMLGICHSLFMETAIIGQMKGRPWHVLAARVSISLVLGLIANLILPAGL